MTNNFHPMVCREDRDLARCLTFIFETRRAADPNTRLDNLFVTLLRSMEYGNVIAYNNELGEVVGMVCYSIGTAEEDFADTNVAHVDYCLMAPSLQRTFYFFKCLHFLVQTVMCEHPDVNVFKMEAYAEDKRNNRLYAKWAQKTGQIQGKYGLLNVYTTSAEQLQAYIRNMMARKKGGFLLQES